MSDRSLYLVCYDIESPKRWRAVYRYLQGFRIGGQKSFFECWLTPSERQAVSKTLDNLLDEKADRAHIFQLDSRMAIDYLGTAKAQNAELFMIL